MSRWHWILIGMIVWLAFGALGLRWVLGPYRWMLFADTCGCKDVDRLKSDFSFHLASIPTNAPGSNAAGAADEVEGLDPALVDWGWRESIARFAVVFCVWMFGGWFVLWSIGRLKRSLR